MTAKKNHKRDSQVASETLDGLAGPDNETLWPIIRGRCRIPGSSPAGAIIKLVKTFLKHVSIMCLQLLLLYIWA